MSWQRDRPVFYGVVAGMCLASSWQTAHSFLIRVLYVVVYLGLWTIALHYSRATRDQVKP